jgi:hypothetical protein
MLHGESIKGASTKLQNILLNLFYNGTVGKSYTFKTYKIIRNVIAYGATVIYVNYKICVSVCELAIAS